MRSTADLQLCALQREQYGIVTRMQARAVGLSYAALRRRIATGVLLELHPGVFADPAVEMSFEQRALGAVLAAGEPSFASHETAAQLWRLPLPRPAAIEITTTLERSPQIAGARRHRSGLLIDTDVTVVGRIPRATPERTIVDLSSRLSMRELGRLTDDALHRHLSSLGRIQASAMRLPAAPGRSPKKLFEMLARRLPGAEQRESRLEDFVFESLHRHRLAVPSCQHVVWYAGKRRRIDCCYPDALLALEAQGFDAHGRRAQFDADALRGNELQLAGFRVLEFTSAFTDRQIAEQVAEALGLPRPPVVGEPLTFAAWLDRLERQCA
jgi:very-short-patch-repair endonuclease